MKFNDNLINYFMNGIVNGTYDINIIEFKPKFIANNAFSNFKEDLINELERCNEFYFCVSFIRMSGVYLLDSILNKLEENNIKGKIITTDYLYLTEPSALKKLNEHNNIEIRLFPANPTEGFHIKGYIFKKDNFQSVIIGSSNISNPALTNNKEWNLKIQMENDNDFIKNINNEFLELWNQSDSLEDIIEDYENKFNQKKNSVIQFMNNNVSDSDGEITPNKMQKEFIENLEALIHDEENKGLLVSATGTGKTYAAGLAFNNILNKNEKVLFIAHMGVILKQALDSFKKIFDDDFKMECLITSHGIPDDFNILFSTRQTLTQENGEKRYDKFDKKEFDYIIIDEAHQSASDTYLEIIDYFEPKFFLGMTATPDRSDERNVYELFDFNVVQDIRLKQALDENLLCPFYYYGISDISLNGEFIEFDDFNNIESEILADILIEKSHEYPVSGNMIKALVFCRNIEEGELLADLFNQKGHPSVFLGGSANDQQRLDSINSLESDDDGSLEYIFTVKIFNEGVDIPQVNQVLMIRPTESSIMFIQQLGRGLRKHESKDFVVILDFIGNYKNNYLIPFALTGDISYDGRIPFNPEKLPGNVTVNLDEIARKKILDSIDTANKSGDLGLNLFRKKFIQLFDRLGRIPYLFDFYNEQELDPIKILNHNEFDIYADFLKDSFNYFDKDKYRSYFDKFIQLDDYTEVEDITSNEIKVTYLKFISKYISNGYRPHELIILKELSENQKFTINDISNILKEFFNINEDFSIVEQAISILDKSYFFNKDGTLNKNLLEFEQITFFEKYETDYIISHLFKELLNDDVFKKHFLDVINYSLLRFKNEYNENILKNNSYLQINQFYSREDVIRLLGWQHHVEPIAIGGYFIYNNNCIIFTDVSSNSPYSNEFIDSNTLSWSSKNDTYLDDENHENDEDLEKIRDYKSNGLNIHLFVKNGIGTTYCYLGLVDHEMNHHNDYNGDKPVVRFYFKLRNPLIEGVKDYMNLEF